MSSFPLVSVIALCHNHASFVEEALQSVMQQTYPNVELIVVDDASTDGSTSKIRAFTKQHPLVQCIFLETNQGNCKAFNRGLVQAKGVYIIDFATDDVMYPQRIEKQVGLLEAKGDSYGVAFSDADLIDERGQLIRSYYARTVNGKLKNAIPSGAVYPHLVKRQFICTPTMMMRKALLDALGGYDESLSYEDYDFWVRSGQITKYAFSAEILTAKREVRYSHGKTFFSKQAGNHLVSTLLICQKAKILNRTQEDDAALAVSVRYHRRLSVLTEHFELAQQFFDVLKSIDSIRLSDRLWGVLAARRIRLHRLYQKWLQWRYGLRMRK